MYNMQDILVDLALYFITETLTQIIMKVMKTEEWLSNRTQANNFSAYVYRVRQPFYFVRTCSVRWAI